MGSLSCPSPKMKNQKSLLEHIETIRSEAIDWQKYRNNKEVTVNWQFTTDNARIKLSDNC